MNDQTRGKLAEFISSDTYRQLKEEVFRNTTVSVLGMPAAEAGIAMALEKGVRLSFYHIEKASEPQGSNPTPRLRNTVTNNRKKE